MAKGHDDSFSKTRMEALTDGIFATVMTILILSLIVPIITSPNSTQQLTSEIFSFLPSVVIYIFSFTVLLVMWIGHNNIFRFIHSVNPRTFWLNGFFLLLIGFVPLSTAFLGKYPLQRPALIFYAINFLLLAITFKLFNDYVRRHHHESEGLLGRSSKNTVVALAIYSFSILFAFVSPYISLFLFGLMPVFYFAQAFLGMYRDVK